MRLTEDFAHSYTKVLLYLRGAKDFPGSQPVCQAPWELKDNGHHQVRHRWHEPRFLQFEMQHICAVKHSKCDMLAVTGQLSTGLKCFEQSFPKLWHAEDFQVFRLHLQGQGLSFMYK